MPGITVILGDDATTESHNAYRYGLVDTFHWREIAPCRLHFAPSSQKRSHQVGPAELCSMNGCICLGFDGTNCGHKDETSFCLSKVAK